MVAFGDQCAGLVLITAVSVVLVIGGSYLHPKEAGWGGLVGGLTLTFLLLMLSLGLLLSFDQVTGVAVPTLALFDSIHPVFSTVMVWIIYVMIYSTCIGQYYSLGRRLSASRPKRFYPIFAAAAVVGFVISFIGFEQLMAHVYPALGFLGLLLAVVLAAGYLREWPKIDAESKRRVLIRALFTRRFHPDQSFTRHDAQQLGQLVEESPMTERDMHEAVVDEVIAELAADESVDFEIGDGGPHPAEPLTEAEIAALPAEEPDGNAAPSGSP